MPKSIKNVPQQAKTKVAMMLTPEIAQSESKR